MADKTLYEILEVSPTASADAIRAAYERLSMKLDPDRAENQTHPQAKFLYDAVKEAFLTLGNLEKRAQYDKRLDARSRVLQNVEVVEPFWTVPKLIVVAIAAIGIGGYYYQHKKEEARLAAERTIAVAKAKEAEERAKAEAAQAAQARLEYQQRLREQAAEERQRRDRDASLRRFEAERRVQDQRDYMLTERERREKAIAEQRADAQRRREETQAVNAARQQAARDRAELCRVERERYGKAISC